MRLSGEIIRDVQGDDSQAQIQFINDVLDRWHQDIDDFDELACQFYSTYIHEER